MPRTPKPIDHEDVTDVLGVVEDRITPTPIDASFDAGHMNGRPGAIIGRRAVSVPGAIGGAVLVCALAFGANLGSFGLASSESGPDAQGATGADQDTADAILGLDGYDGTFDDPEHPGGESEPGEETSDPTEGPDGSAEPTDKPAGSSEPTEKPDATEKPDPTKKPEPTQEPKPSDATSMALELTIKEGAVRIDWTACNAAGADYYKVVRSTDSTVRWPAGDNDEFIAAVEVGGATKAWDEHAPAGKKVWYRVFCVRATDDGYKVVDSTDAQKITTPDKPEPTPTPEPSELWIEAELDGAAVVLHWEACDGDGFSHYRILRKVDGDASVIAEVEDQDTTTFVDDDVEPGVTYHYLVQAKGHVGDDWFLLGTTEWTAIAVE